MNIKILRDYAEENWHSMDVYADNLIANLNMVGDNTINVSTFVTFPHVSRMFSSDHKHIRHIFRYIVNPFGATFTHADIYHITDHANAHLIAALDPQKTIITCHDLTAPYWMKSHLELTTKKRIKYAIEEWRLSFMKKAARIIAVSQATKNDIVKKLCINPDKIAVIPEGVSGVFVKVNDKKRQRTIIDRYRLPERYILHVGTTYHNKNIEGLLQIFFSLAHNDKTLHLVKVGDPWTNTQNTMIEESPYFKRIHHVGFVEKSDLPSLYSLSLALIQPSFAEGFGFTVLEAMACGCPVVVSDIPALQEMVRDAGVYISVPHTSRDVQAIDRMVKSVTQRHTLITKGMREAKRYSWATCARDTLNIYTQVVHHQAQ